MFRNVKMIIDNNIVVLYNSYRLMNNIKNLDYLF